MVWTEDYEVLFCREVRLRDLYRCKDGSRERGHCLDRIAESVNAVPTLWFKVDQRALRDKLNKLLKDYISKRNKEERDTGISPDHRELDDLLQDICERKQESEATYAEKNLEKAKKIEEERDAAEKIRRTSMGRLSETRKREGVESSSKLSEKKMRSSGSDTISCLRVKVEKDFKLRNHSKKSATYHVTAL